MSINMNMTIKSEVQVGGYDLIYREMEENPTYVDGPTFPAIPSSSMVDIKPEIEDLLNTTCIAISDSDLSNDEDLDQEQVLRSSIRETTPQTTSPQEHKIVPYTPSRKAKVSSLKKTTEANQTNRVSTMRMLQAHKRQHKIIEWESITEISSSTQWKIQRSKNGRKVIGSISSSFRYRSSSTMRSMSTGRSRRQQ
jgi:hypothetical protein